MITDQDIMLALIGQVADAHANLKKNICGPCTEADIQTIISRPMWNAFCRATKMPENSKPTPWLGIHKTRRVYGSATHVVESEHMFSFSY